METIFEKIIKKKLAATIVYEDDDIIAIKDINPIAEVHLLIISKKKIPSFQEIKNEDLLIMQKITRIAQKLAREFKVEKGYRLVTNIGPASGQSIFHLHFHLIGGKDLGKMA